MAAETSPEDQATAAALSERLQSDDNEIVSAAIDECLLHTPQMREGIRSILEPIFGNEWDTCESEVKFASDLIARSDAGDARATIRLAMQPILKAIADLPGVVRQAQQTEAYQAQRAKACKRLFPEL